MSDEYSSVTSYVGGKKITVFRNGDVLVNDRKICEMPLPKLDQKFYGRIQRIKDGAEIPDDSWMVFVAKDNAFAVTLPFYLEQCIKLGADERQIEAVNRVIVKVATWRAANPDKCKVPDIEPGEILIKE